jgi:hypothetical protein
MRPDTAVSDHLVHVGGGSALVLAWLGLIPGVIPTVALTVLVVAVLAVPVVALGLIGAVIAAPVYLASRIVRRARRRRRRDGQQAPRIRPIAVPTPHTS